MKPKVYTVKSNARRDARKRGLDPNCVVACDRGFIIKDGTSPTEGSKRDSLRSMLLSGWQSMDRLQSSLGWQPHTIRGLISRISKAEGLAIGRKREGQTTFYRAERAS